MQIEGSNGIFVGGASGMCQATAEQFVENHLMERVGPASPRFPSSSRSWSWGS